MWAWARFAMNSWVAGGMALSWVVTRYQDGIVFQAGTPDLLLKASTENGRWVAKIWSRTAGLTSAANPVATPCLVRQRSVPWEPSGSG
jgi:hypothetical protein